MPMIRQFVLKSRQFCDSCAQSAGVFLRDVGSGMLEVSHNTLALLGLIAVALLIFVAGRPELRQSLEGNALSWLQARQEARADPADALANDLSEPDAIARVTASDPKDLTRKQAAVALWLSRRYRVAPEPVSRLVVEAWQVGAKAGLDPTLILAIMAVESSFNPFAQSSVGEDVGETTPRRVLYFAQTGRVLVKHLRTLESRAIASREEQYFTSFKQKPVENDVELF